MKFFFLGLIFPWIDFFDTIFSRNSQELQICIEKYCYQDAGTRYSLTFE